MKIEFYKITKLKKKLTARAKHIDIKFHLIKDLISNNFLSLNYCPTERMLAHILTKPLPKNKFQELRQGIGLITYSHWEGDCWNITECTVNSVATGHASDLEAVVGLCHVWNIDDPSMLPSCGESV
ncbi:hypothetical protein LAZ67_10002377 [Cordylochernes scorpioides]|uniref:Uncharacterized protein n=1 Tax=Cordylochernes scorpioides TaxID=51811 RepID=A0ABY6L1J3_9ARAC|nr:hypothetical protein LAZ67_10002377 [Cordylochernes scorpioides]